MIFIFIFLPRVSVTYNLHKVKNKRKKERERLRKIGAYYSPEMGIVIEGFVPMAMALCVRVCVYVCGHRLTGP